MIFVLSAILVWCDWVAFRRYVHPNASLGVRRIVGALFVVANLLPYISMAVLWFELTQNIVPMMWLLTIYTILSLSRLALYCGILLIKNGYIKWVVGVMLSAVVVWVSLVGVVRTRRDFTIRSVEVASARLPQSFDGYRIALFSDAHIGSMTSASKMCREIVDKINSLDADLVIFGGDLVNARYDELTPELAAILGEIKSRDGIVAVLGNHDTGVYVRDTLALPIEENTRLLVERIECMGWRIENDETECLVRGCDTLTLTGIGFSRELLDHRHSADADAEQGEDRQPGEADGGPVADGPLGPCSCDAN